VGVLDCQSENLNHFDSETIDLLTLFSTQASMALQNARLYSLENVLTWILVSWIESGWGVRFRTPCRIPLVTSSPSTTY
jgi:hypothetical protein